MRELNAVELKDVKGGLGLLGAGIGFVVGGVSSYLSGGDAGDVAGAALLGAASGAFGGLATATKGVVKGFMVTNAVAYGVASAVVGQKG